MKDIDVSNVILGKAGEEDRFILEIWGIKFKMSIKPLRVKDLIEACGELSNIREIPDKAMFTAVIESAEDLKYVVRAITISTRTRFRRIVNYGISRLPVSDIDTLFTIFKKQIDMERFFFILISTKGIQILKKQKEE